jgi:hypothetical protein
LDRSSLGCKEGPFIQRWREKPFLLLLFFFFFFFNNNNIRI